MEKTGNKVTVKSEQLKQEDHGSAGQAAAGSASTTVLPLQQGARLPADRFAVILPEFTRGAPAQTTITINIGDQRIQAKSAEAKREKAVKAKICLDPDEYLTGMKGHVGEFGGGFRRSADFIQQPAHLRTVRDTERPAVRAALCRWQDRGFPWALWWPH
ncbi:hypothetical protein ZWY2020_031457 [Hordeum vulgare]|nr:hypothetical protein ZWY2020_031457 [Hordeum vulgare]